MTALTRREAIQLSLAAVAGSLTVSRPSHADSPVLASHDLPSIRRATVDLALGTRLHYAEMGAADSPVIVCLHGYTDSWHSFRPVMPLLSQTHRVIAVDMRGHGETPAGHEPYSLDSVAGDVVAVMDALSIQRASVMGHSYGTFVARRVATSFGPRVERLVLIAGGRSPANSAVRGLLDQVVAQGERISPEFAGAFQASTVLDRALVPEWFFERCVAASLSVQPRIWREALAALISDSKTANDVHFPCPTLVLGGELDAVFSGDEQREFAHAIAGSKLLLYRHCGHAPNWEQPARVAEDVQDFIAA